MHASACNPVVHRAVRILSARSVDLALRRFRLPSYRAVKVWLEDYQHRVRIVALWDAVFGGVPENLRDGKLDTWDLELAFMERVDDELFPVDMEWVQNVYAENSSPFEIGIPVAGYGIAWEMEDLNHLRNEIGLVLITALQSDSIDPPEEAYWRVGDEETFEDEVLSYCLARDVDVPAWNLPQTWDGLMVFRAALSALPGPFNGLADVLNTLLKTTGNTFLDSVDMFWQAEYDGAYWFQYCWCPACIEDLRVLHEQAKPAIGRIRALYDWCDRNPATARAQLLAALAAAAGGAPFPEVQP